MTTTGKEPALLRLVRGTGGRKGMARARAESRSRNGSAHKSRETHLFANWPSHFYPGSHHRARGQEP